MITKPQEMDFSKKPLTCIIAGVPGIGKTTLALSAPKPLLIDLDGGVSRVEAKYRTDTLTASSVEEIYNDLQGTDLSVYESIVIDTGGRLLEFLKPVVIAENPKHGQRDGSLSLKGYGAVKRKFAEFLAFVKRFRKNVIIVFHASEVPLQNDLTGLRIRIEGSSRDEVWDDVDIGGFVEMVGNDRTIGFSPTERYYAKGTHGVHGVYAIPNLAEGVPNTFLSDLFRDIAKGLNEEVRDAAKYREAMDIGHGIVDNTKDPNDALEALNAVEHALTSKIELWTYLKTKAEEQGFHYNKESKRFE